MKPDIPNPSGGLPPAVAATATALVAGQRPGESERLALAAHPAAPPQALEALAGELDDHVLCAVAGNPATPPHVLYHMYTRSTPTMMLRLAGNPSTDVDTLELIAEEWSVDTGSMIPILKAIGAHPAATGELLETVWDHPDANDAVHATVAVHPEATEMRERYGLAPEGDASAGVDL